MTERAAAWPFALKRTHTITSGSISVTSKPGKGTAFTIKLLLAKIILKKINC
jgi:chemotaxis protein histidine kinase CheA